MMERMHLRRRRRVAPLIAAAAAAAALVGCNASRPSSATPGTESGLGPPVEQPAAGSEPAATADPGDGPTVPASDPTAGTAAPSSVATAPTGSIATNGTATTVPPGPLSTTTLPRPTEAEWAAVDTYLQERLLDAGDFAFGIAVSIDGVPVHAASFGVRNAPDAVPEPEPVDSTTDSDVSTTTSTTTTTLPPPPPEPVDVTDRFRIASLSKIITGTVTLQLVEAGQLSLDEPVGGRLGAALGVDVAGRPAESITVRQLLAHTTGFNEFRNTFFGRGVENCREAGARGLAEGLQYDAGTTYQYSNMNFCLLGLLIEDVTGEPYEQAVYERLLTPLGISGMRLAGTFDPDPNEVRHPSVPTRNYMETLGGAGAWVATPSDMVRILDSLDNTNPGFHPLSDATTSMMRQAQSGIAYDNPLERWYGLATIVFANRSWGHTGTIENTHTIVMHRPDGMTWSLLVSGNYPDETDDLIDIFQDAIDQAGIDAPAPTTTTTTTTSTTTTSTTVVSTVPSPSAGGSTSTTAG
jgi:D-alanyl-D-alanine carboxypeptidase